MGLGLRGHSFVPCDSGTTALADFLAGDVSSSSIAVGNAERTY